MTIKSPYLSCAEAAEHLRFIGPHALKHLRRFLARHRIPYFKRGRAVLVRREDLDAALQIRRVS